MTLPVTLKKSETQNLGINSGLLFKPSVKKTKQTAEITNNSMKCPAQCGTTGKCYSTPYFLAKPGKPTQCIRPCKYQERIEQWNEVQNDKS